MWNAVEILEWISKHNLRAVFGVEDALEFERRLAGNVLADPSLNSPIVRAIERDVARQKRPRDKV